MLKYFTSVIMIMFMLGCSSDYDKRLKISATTWIGYTPLFYAKEKGWLEPLNIKLLNVSSLAENMYLYKAGNADAYVGTQYEYLELNSEMKSLQPIMMFDRSNGGDLILSNLSTQELSNTESIIDVYLEVDSINSLLLSDFLKKNKIEEKKINYINKDQSKIELLKASDTPTIIVTYIPYNHKLMQNGFKEVASTKENLDLLVVDAMFTQYEVFNEHKQQFLELKGLVNKSILKLHENPREFYDSVKPYLLEISYAQFIASLSDIVWINKNMSKELQKRIIKTGLPLRDLI